MCVLDLDDVGMGWCMCMGGCIALSAGVTV